jgi:hypothetical protein
MLARITNSWTVFTGLVFGIILLMISIRPDLQARPGNEQTPAEEIEVVGQILTGSCGAVLTYRMVRGLREQTESDRSKRDV